MKKKNSQRVCVIMPAYNEGSVVYKVIKDAKRCFQKHSASVNLLVVNDGSTDNTSSEARRAGALVIDHILNSGAGEATTTGLVYADHKKYDLAVTMDADGQHSPEDVLRGIDNMINGEADLLIGSRLIDSTGMSKTKVIGNKGLSFITLLMFGINSTDSQSGLRVFSRHAIENLRWKTSNYEFCSEMLWRAKQAKMTVGEFPIQAIYTDYSKSKGQNNWNAINIIKSLLKRRFLEIFG